MTTNFQTTKKTLIMFIIFGITGSLIMDADHAAHFIEHPNLIKQVTSPEKYWEIMKGNDGRNLHVPLIVMVSLLVIIAEVWSYENEFDRK